MITSYVLSVNAKVKIQGFYPEFEEGYNIEDKKLFGYLHDTTLLHIAVMHGQTKIVKKVLNENKQVKCNIDAQDLNGET